MRLKRGDARRSSAKPRPPLPRAREIVSQIRREPNELKRKMLLVGYLTDALSRKEKVLYKTAPVHIDALATGRRNDELALGRNFGG